jgi:hypothetical protein
MSNPIDSVFKSYQLQILCEGAAFEWDKKNSWVNRGEGGKFAKSAGSSTEDADKESTSGAKDKIFKSVSAKVDQIAGALDKLPESDLQKISQAINSPNMQKARVAARAKFDAIGKEAGEAYSMANAQMAPVFQKHGSDFKKAVAEAKRIAKGIVDTTKENPELVVAGAMGAILATVGTGGAIAFFTIPNLFGLGGVYGGIAAMVGQQSVSQVVSAFALGGLSQISFGVSIDLIAGGLALMVSDAAILGDAVSQKLKKK